MAVRARGLCLHGRVDIGLHRSARPVCSVSRAHAERYNARVFISSAVPECYAHYHVVPAHGKFISEKRAYNYEEHPRNRNT